MLSSYTFGDGNDTRLSVMSTGEGRAPLAEIYGCFTEGFDTRSKWRRQPNTLRPGKRAAPFSPARSPR